MDTLTDAQPGQDADHSVRPEAGAQSDLAILSPKSGDRPNNHGLPCQVLTRRGTQGGDIRWPGAAMAA